MHTLASGRLTKRWPATCPLKVINDDVFTTEAPVATVPEERSAEDAAGKNVAEVGDLGVQFSPPPSPGTKLPVARGGRLRA